MALAEQFQRVEDEYYRLKGKFSAGRMTGEQLDAALRELIVQDAQGRYWMVGANTGEWYSSDGGTWIKATPPAEIALAAVVPAPPSLPPAARPDSVPAPALPTTDRTRAAEALRYGGFWRRLLAYLLDVILVGLVSRVLLGPLTDFVIDAPALAAVRLNVLGPAVDWMSTNANASAVTTIGLVLSVLLAALYFVGFWTLAGRTPGKFLLGMKIIDREGQRPGLLRSLVRYVGMFISGFLFCLGFIWIGVDARKQGWHDKLAGTLVVRA